MRTTIILATLILPVVALSGCDWLKGSKGANGSNSPGGALNTVKSPSVECAADLAEIRALYATIPDDLRKDDGGEIPVPKRVEKCTALLESWNKRCDPATVEGGFETRYLLARLLLADWQNFLLTVKNNPVQRAGLDSLAVAYLNRIVNLCQKCLEGSTPDQKWYVDALDLQADVLLRNHRYEDALATYQRVIKEFPDYHELDKSKIGASQCYFKLRQPENSLALLRAALDAETDDIKRLRFMQARWKPLLMTGDFQPMTDYLDEMEDYCRTNLKREDLPDHETLAFLKHLTPVNYHRVLYTLFPQGKFKEALATISAYRKEIAVLQARATKMKRTLAGLNGYETFAGMVETTLEKLAGRHVPPGFDQVIWAGDRKVKVKQPHDKVIAIVFHSNVKKGERTSKFIEALDHFARDNEDKLDLCWFVRQASQDPHIELNDLREAAGKLRLTHTALGVDADYQNYTLFERFHAPLISGSVIIIDKSGRVVFQFLDPQWLHIGLAINTIRQYF